MKIAITGNESFTAVTATFNALGSKGGRLTSAAGLRDYVSLTGPLIMTGDDFTASHLDWSWFKKTVNGDGSDPGAVIAFIQNPTRVDHIKVSNLRVTGNSATADKVKAIQMGYSQFVRFSDVFIEDVALEGFYWPGTPACAYAWITGCYAKNVGLRADGTKVAAYNTNASWVILANSQSYNVGRHIEHAGRGIVVNGNIFRKNADGAIGLQLFSTTFANELGAAVGNIITESFSGVEVGDPADSIGKLLVASNVHYQVRTGVTLAGKASAGQPCLAHGNMFIDSLDHNAGGSKGNAVAQLLDGGHVFAGNLISSSYGTCKGSIAYGSSGATANILIIGPSTLLPPTALSTNGHSIGRGSSFTVAGVSGTKYCTDISEDKSTITFTPPISSDESINDAVVTFSGCKWNFLCLSTKNDYPIFRDNTIIGQPWIGTAFRFSGTRFTIHNNVFESRGASYGSIPLLQILDVGGGVGAQLFANTIDVTRPFTISDTLPTVFYATTWPAAGTYKRGDVRLDPAPSAGGNRGEICVADGTRGTLSGITATTTLGSPNVTLAGGSYAGAGVYAGAKLLIAGEYGGTAVTVLSGLGSSILVDTNATVGVGPGAAVSYKAPTLKTWGAIAA
jgi:hypothetical protein